VPRVLLALLLAATLLPCAQARDVLQAIDDCVARLDSELDVGYARVAARCPELTPALGESSFAAWLPADWRRPDNQLSAAGLSELRAQLARESGRGEALRPPPRTERVATVLAAVTHGVDAGSISWWQRFKDWLRRTLATRAQADSGGLRRWLAGIELSTATTQLITWAALAVVVALAAGILINELRIAGVLRARTTPPQPGGGELPRGGSAATLGQLESATPEQQPALLLELIAVRLAALQRLPPARALTARELEREARLPEESARARLVELVTVCERVRFSDEPVSSASLAAAVRAGRALLGTLAGAPLAARAAEA
jgi:hypothetical protein